jgi:pimeloyl-ACP methyl ester carboxylesterase
MVPNGSEESPYKTGQWDAFADQLYDIVKPAGKVALVGLSAGAMLSLRMAERHQGDKDNVIKGVVAVSPFLVPAGDFTGKPIAIPNNTVSTALRVLHFIFGLIPFIGDWLIDTLLATQTHDMGAPPTDPATGKPVNWGFRYPTLDNLLALTDAGHAALSDAGKLKGQNIQFIVSDADSEADAPTNEALATSNGFGLHVFSARDGVPHALSSPIDDPTHPRAVVTTRDIILERLDASLPSLAAPALATGAAAALESPSGATSAVNPKP